MKVVLYYGFGREGKARAPNSTWLFKGSVLVALPEASPCLVLREQIVWGETH